ncbi:MAG: hypothetical protein MK102_18440 [Fuerstiella sp.]|nr:hypothetical protein [Fuerstiella sp.]
MPPQVMNGRFYEFSRNSASEIGRSIPRIQALHRLKRGQDVYTPVGNDARALAKDVQKGKADWEGSHQQNFYPHYHAAGNHNYGHVFYGERGFRQGQNRRT